MGDAIASVNPDVNDLPVLRGLLAEFDRLKADHNDWKDKHLALALGVDPAQVTRWRQATGRTVRTNDTTRAAIASLDQAGDTLVLGKVLGEMRKTVEDIETAIEIRSALAVVLTGVREDARELGLVGSEAIDAPPTPETVPRPRKKRGSGS